MAIGAPPELPGAPPGPGGLGLPIFGAILRALAEAGRSLIEFLAYSLGRALQLTAPALKGPWQAQITAAGAALVAAAEVEGGITLSVLLVGVAEGGAIAVGTLVVGFAIAIVVTTVEAARKKLLADVLYRVNAAIPTYRMAAEDSVRAYRRGGFTPNEVTDDLRDLGVDDRRSAALILGSYRGMGVAEIRELYYRGLIDPNRAIMLLAWTELPEDQVSAIIGMWGAQGAANAERGVVNVGHLPTASDLQHFVSRHIFDPDGRDLFGKFPPTDDYYRWAALLGMSREVADLHWLAHWDLIAPGQAIAAWHRLGDAYHDGTADPRAQDLADRQGVKNLLRFREIYPGYQDPLIDSSWNGLSAFLIRAMIETSSVADGQAAELLQWNQVRPEFIPMVIQWAHTSKHANAKEATHALLLTAYKDHLITADDLTAHLSALGETEDAIQIAVAVADYELHGAQAKLDVAAIEARYKKGQATPDEVIQVLTDLGKTPEAITSLLAQWDAVKHTTAPARTEAELIAYYKNGVLDPTTLRDRLEARHIPDDDIDLILRSADAELTAAQRRSHASSILIATARQRLRGGQTNPSGFIDEVKRAGLTDAQAQTELAYETAIIQAHPPRPPKPPPLPYQTPEAKIRISAAKIAFRNHDITSDTLAQALAAQHMPPNLIAATVAQELARATKDLLP